MRDPACERALQTGLVVGLLLAFASPAKAAEPVVDYSKQIKPILKQRCYGCHGALKQQGHLRLDTAGLLRKGGDAGPAIEPGHAEESLLIDRITEKDASLRMPPEGSPLTPEQVTAFRQWIDQGAKSPADEKPETDPRKHWAFLPPARPDLSAELKAHPGRSPIDILLDRERRKLGVEPLAKAEPHVLLRRVYLDLIGLPPSREELREFLKDPSDTAYEKVVDRLLASPQHGERWARHWMDVWRYSDWYGRRAVPDVLNSYAQIWRWRDWIVRSLNDDRGYDSMVRAMLAADEMTPEDRSETVATGFVVRNFYRWNYSSWLKDNVEHTGKAFLALTFNCAHCHDHKYDPIKHEDYFAFRAIFEPIEIRHDRVPGEPDPGPYPTYDYGKAYGPITSGLVRVYDKTLDAKTYLYTRGESRNVVPGRPPIEPGMPSFLSQVAYRLEPVSLPTTVSHPGTQAFVKQEELASRESALKAADAAFKASQERLKKAGGKEKDKDGLLTAGVEVDERVRAGALADLAAIHARILAEDARASQSRETFEALSLNAARAERWAASQKAAVEVARAKQVLAQAKAKGTKDLKKPEAGLAAATKALELAQAKLKEESGAYTPIAPEFPGKSTGRRTALAKWLTDRANPLTARVAANHIWRWHFGQPIVSTTHDFGRNGTLPTHPELLDWLALELMDQGNGWSMKSLHRKIVTSEAYKMRSHDPASTVAAKLDRSNRTLWKFPPARMESEVVRDSMLKVAGVLDLTMGGADIPMEQGDTVRRRSLYFTHHGEQRMLFLETFDAPDACDAYKRTTSVVPRQALAMVNNESLLGLSTSLADRLWKECSGNWVDPKRADEVFLSAGFETVLSRPPSAAERELSLRFLAEQTALLKSEANSGPSPDALARRDFIHALFSHTDFLTIH